MSVTWKCSKDVDLDVLIDQTVDMIKSHLTHRIQNEKITFDIKGKIILDKKQRNHG